MNGPQDDLMHEDWRSWAKTNESVFVSAFSAVCLLTARYMADVLGKNKVNWHRNQDLLWNWGICPIALQDIWIHLGKSITFKKWKKFTQTGISRSLKLTGGNNYSVIYYNARFTLGWWSLTLFSKQLSLNVFQEFGSEKIF